jgi:nucleoside-diphosphate-sugar epimerase
MVAGANGISGTYVVKVLAESPERWSKVYALSRGIAPGRQAKQVEQIAVDFLKMSPQQIADALIEHRAKADYVFFCAYLQPPADEGKSLWENAELLTQTNLTMLSNFLEALPLANSLPKRIIIQFGMKYYGVHLGPTAVPQEEDDPRIDFEPNFYYAQHDYLKAFCERHNIGWKDTRPGVVLGAVRGAAMNITLPLVSTPASSAILGFRWCFPAIYRHGRSPRRTPAQLWLSGRVGGAHGRGNQPEL